jgi:hypothetical protein
MKATSTFSCLCVKLLSCALVILLFAPLIQAQDKEHRVFDAVPEQVRARLMERLKLYVEYQRAKDYEKLYDLYTESTIKNVFKGQSREEFAAAYRKGDEEGKSTRILEFRPTSIDKSVSMWTSEGADEAYSIYGDAKLWRPVERVEKPIAIEAQLKNGEWYFSAIVEIVND